VLRKRLTTAAALCSLLLLAAACGGTAKPSAPADVDWPSFGGTPAGTRSSALDGVDVHNVDRLGVAWSRQLGQHESLSETYPVVVGGTMYVTTNESQVIALDATTGAQKWQYTPRVDLLAEGALGSSPISRGVTVAAGRVYLATFDDRLIALDAQTGTALWDRVVANPRTGATQNSPPSYWKGLLIIGSAGDDIGVRGFVAAYDAATGAQRWRFNTVPAPGRGWMPPGPNGGGGHVWMPPTVDPATATVYAGTGNRSPGISASPRAGCDRWADATIALDARTGRLRWGHSEQCGDVWDYDSGQPPVVFRPGAANGAGAGVPTVGHANKGGTYWLLRADNGHVIAKSPPLVPQSSPRPLPTAKGERVCPGALGGIAYSPAAIGQESIYQTAAVQCMTYRTNAGAGGRTPGRFVEIGGGIAQPIPGMPTTGEIVALDQRTAKVRWRRAMPAPMVGGALATAGGLVFSGSDDGYLYAFADADGSTVWRGHVGLAFGSAPLTYRVDGVQYIAVAAGGSSLAQLSGSHVGARLVVLRLGGRPLR
jgi:PQQ-dependent dehydrogenase (methanol/ethanol family)